MPVFVAQSFGGQSLSSRPSRRRVEGSCIGFWKSKANSTFCKVVKQKGETFWQPLQPWFVKETAFFFAKAAFFFAKAQNSGIRLVLDSGNEYRIYAQSFAFAVFATLICQINSVFPCKDTKAAKSVAFCDSLPVFFGTEL